MQQLLTDIQPELSGYDGEVKIIDFGIATDVTDVTDDDTPDADTPAGSLPYISPEQTSRMNRTVDHRTDFYSLAATLYELLIQRPLFFVKDPAVMPILWRVTVVRRWRSTGSHHEPGRGRARQRSDR